MKSSDEINVTSPPRTRTQRALKWLALSVAGLVLLLGVALVGFTVLMARVPEYRSQLQAWLSERSKLDIEFDAARAGWRGYGPELQFSKVVVRSPDRQRVLARAELGGIGFDFWQALRNRRLASARIVLEGTEIRAQRRVDGEFEVVGQADWPEFSGGQSLKLDALPVGSLAIRNVRLMFRDLKTGRGPWTIDQVSLDVTRALRAFDIEVAANLPEGMGKSLKLTAHGKGRLNEMDKLQWRTQLAGTELDLHGLRQIMPTNWFAPSKGQGSLLINADFIGAQPQGFSGRIDFVDVRLTLPHWQMPLPQADPLQVRDEDAAEADGPPAPTAPVAQLAAAPNLEYRNIGLEFAGVRNAQEWSIHFKRLQLNREDSAWMPATANLSLRFARSASDTQDAKQYVQQVQASAQLIVLENLWPLLAYLPESTSNARLRALNASGRIKNLSLRYEREQPDAAPRYGVRAEFADVGVSPVAATPGISGMSGVISATGARGQVRLDSRDVALSMPRIFRTPLPLDQISGAIDWVTRAEGVQLRSQALAVANEDGKASAAFTLDVPHQGAVMIDMQATGTDLHATAAPRYMPAGIMRKRSLSWLDAAFPAGVVKHAQATLKGPLNKFPFRNDEGLFLIKAHLEDLTLQYQAGWMPATHLAVDVEFRNAGLSASASAGRINDLRLEHAEGRIPDFRNMEISIKAQTHGELADALTYVQQSPVGPTIGNLFQQLSAKGAMRADAQLYFPLQDFAKRRVDINIAMQDAELALAGFNQHAEQLNGTLRVLNDGVVGANVRGQFLQGEFRATTEPVGRGRYNLVANGQVRAQPLTQFLRLPAWVKLDGATRYRFAMPAYAQRDLQPGGSRRLYNVDSDLRGMEVGLPAPVYKSAADARAFHLETDLRDDEMTLRGAFGELRSLVRLKQSNDAWRFERGGLRADGIAAALPGHAGLRIDGHLDNLVLDDWLRLGGANAGNASAANGNPARATRVQEVLTAANVNIDRFRLYGFEWPKVRGIVQATAAGWQVDVAGEQASGQVVVPYDFASGKPLTLNMETLWVTPVVTDATNAKPRRGSTLDPRELPSLQADIKQFRYGMHDFGALQLTGTRTSNGLQVSSIHLSGESFNGEGSGSWMQVGTEQQNTLALTLDSHDVRSTMQQFNYGDFIAAKRGKLIANLRWPDGLDEDVLGRASGTIEVQLDDGQLLNVQPGAGRVLGLLSIAALPRRLGLDFHDITDKGLAFDRIHADFNVQTGDARTQNLVLRGPTAEIGIVGRMGLGAHDYDQTAVVTGDVSSALPVAGVVAGGPVVGAALLLFAQIFKEPLKGVARAYYHIGGSWDNPQVDRIDADVGKASLSGAELKTDSGTP